MATTAKRLGIMALTLAAAWAWTAYPALAQQPPGAGAAPGGNPAMGSSHGGDRHRFQ